MSLHANVLSDDQQQGRGDLLVQKRIKLRNAWIKARDTDNKAQGLSLDWLAHIRCIFGSLDRGRKQCGSACALREAEYAVKGAVLAEHLREVRNRLGPSAVLVVCMIPPCASLLFRWIVRARRRRFRVRLARKCLYLQRSVTKYKVGDILRQYSYAHARRHSFFNAAMRRRNECWFIP